MKSFKPYPNEHDSLKQTRERRKKRYNFEQKIPMKILSNYSLYFLQKKNSRSSNFLQNLFPPKGSLVNALQKKKGERKAKEAGRRESER